MNRPLDRTLAEAAEQTFENLAFMFSMPEEEPPKAAARARFAGPRRGVLCVIIEQAMLPALAANMLGADDGAPPAPEQQADAFRELANVICGNLLPLIAGADAEFRIEAPEVFLDGHFPDEPPEPLAARAVVHLDTGAAELELYMDRAPADA